ncbi:MAG: hypothetical protein CML66_06030 [Rhodobacteraceae bacterium]|nr:hypothetical protein [Paracoccaceae bacterium]MAY46698.1 hypothetical protein [Paracoccaceae bacterium]
MKPPASEDDFVEPASLRFLRRLVTVLTAVMIGGVLVIIALLVIRSPHAPALPLPDDIALPEGTTLQAVTYGPDFYLVVTNQNTVLVYDRATGDLRKMMSLD